MSSSVLVTDQQRHREICRPSLCPALHRAALKGRNEAARSSNFPAPELNEEFDAAVNANMASILSRSLELLDEGRWRG